LKVSLSNLDQKTAIFLKLGCKGRLNENRELKISQTTRELCMATFSVIPIVAIHFCQLCTNDWVPGRGDIEATFTPPSWRLSQTGNSVFLLHPLVTKKADDQRELSLVNKPIFCDKFHQVLSLLH
jgi:hypothetical protein